MTFSRILSAGASVAGLLFLFCSNAALAAEDMENYRLTEAGLDSYERASEYLYEFMAEHPELQEALEAEDAADEDDLDFTRLAERLEQRAPGIGKAVAKSGMPLDEYFRFTTVFALTAFTVAMMDHYGPSEDAPKLTGVALENAEFVRKHQQRFREFSERMKARQAELEEAAE